MEGEWFPYFESRITEKGEVVYDEPKPDAGAFLIRSIAPAIEANQAKRKKKYEFVPNPQTRAMERVGYYEELTVEQQKQERDDVWDFAILKYRKRNGEVIDLTREEKLELMAKPMFDRYIGRCQQLLGNASVEFEWELEKNVLTT